MGDLIKGKSNQIEVSDHIEEETLKKLIQGTLSEQEQINVLEHLAVCDKCAWRYSECMEHHIIKAPVDLKDSIMERSQWILNKPQRKYLIFYRYCTKIGIGMVASLLFLFGNSNIYTTIDQFQRNTYVESVQFTNSVQEKLKQVQNQFSSSIREEKAYD